MARKKAQITEEMIGVRTYQVIPTKTMLRSMKLRNGELYRYRTMSFQLTPRHIRVRFDGTFKINFVKTRTELNLLAHTV